MENPLWKKLDLKQGSACMFINAPRTFFPLLIGAPMHREVNAFSEANFVMIFTNSHDELSQLVDQLINEIQPTTMVWVCWYKKSSGIRSELSSSVVRSELLKTKLVDTKVCSINDQWSALKFMVRKEFR